MLNWNLSENFLIFFVSLGAYLLFFTRNAIKDAYTTTVSVHSHQYKIAKKKLLPILSVIVIVWIFICFLFLFLFFFTLKMMIIEQAVSFCFFFCYHCRWMYLKQSHPKVVCSIFKLKTYTLLYISYWAKRRGTVLSVRLLHFYIDDKMDVFCCKSKIVSYV